MKNEYDQLKELLDSFQKLPQEKLQVTIVDDHSTKDQLEACKKIVRQYSYAKLVSSSTKKGKKHALYQYIETASEPFIVLIDADCRIPSKEYGTLIEQKLSNSDIVLGYGPFFKSNKILNRFSRFDCMWIASQFLGWAIKGDPYMGVGRNLSVQTSLYQNKLNFIQGKDLQSGDDDMLIQAVTSSNNVDILTHKKSFVFSAAVDSYQELLQQKTRHISTSVRYKLRHKIILILVAIASIFLFPLIFLAIFYLPLSWGISLLIIKIFLSYYTLFPIANALDEKDLILFLPLWEFVYGIHLIVLTFYSLVAKEQVWK